MVVHRPVLIANPTFWPDAISHTTESLPVFRVYGCTIQGHSVALDVHGKYPYLYLLPVFRLSEGEKRISDKEIRLLHLELEEFLSAEFAPRKNFSWDARYSVRQHHVISIERVHAFPMQGYNENTSEFLLVKVAHQGYVPAIRRYCGRDYWDERDRKANYNANWKTIQRNDSIDFVPFECNILFELRFMIDTRAGGGRWIEVPPRMWECIAQHERRTSCSVEARCAVSSITVDSESRDLAPFRILSFDIEVVTENNAFPNTRDARYPVVTVAAHLRQLGGSEPTWKKASSRNVCFQQGEAHDVDENGKPIIDPEIDLLEFQMSSLAGEIQLLDWFCHLVEVFDPDMVTGWNIDDFDLPYLTRRYLVLMAMQKALDEGRNVHYEGMPPDEEGKKKQSHYKWVEQLAELFHVPVQELRKCGMVFSRQIGSTAQVFDEIFESRAHGRRETQRVPLDGRFCIDALRAWQREFKERSYTLNAISAKVLGEQKEDVHHSQINPLFHGDRKDRRKLMIYCVKDALLPALILDEAGLHLNALELASACCILPGWVYLKGQGVKVQGRVLETAQHDSGRGARMLLDYMRALPKSDETYSGAVVLKPVKGLHNTCVYVLDFTSLYPTIIIAHNLCFSTLLTQQQIAQISSQCWEKAPDPYGHKFVRREVVQGLIPRALQTLLDARRVAKRLKAESFKAGDITSGKVYDARQLALKICANSIYGYLGADLSTVRCKPASETTTAFGREAIEYSKTVIEENFPGSRVLYGDTDSVMVTDPNATSIEEAERIGKLAATKVNEGFRKPMNLEPEKVFYPFLLVSKKRYAGVQYGDGKWGDRITKGMESVRRDNCRMTAEMVDRVLDLIVKDHNVDAAVHYVKQEITDLVHGRKDLSRLVISKAMAREYKPNQHLAHVELVKRMRERDPGSEPKMGDRVPYIVIRPVARRGRFMQNQFELSEDPLFAIENNVDYDERYYIENQLEKPLTKIFKSVIGDEEARDLFHGNYTQHARYRIPTPTAGTIIECLQVGQRCMGCSATFRSDQESFCAHCKTNGTAGRKCLEANQRFLQLKCADMRNQITCRVCNGSDIEDLCFTRTCDTLYVRKQVRTELNEKTKLLNGLNRTEHCMPAALLAQMPADVLKKMSTIFCGWQHRIEAATTIDEREEARTRLQYATVELERVRADVHEWRNQYTTAESVNEKLLVQIGQRYGVLRKNALKVNVMAKHLLCELARAMFAFRDSEAELMAVNCVQKHLSVQPMKRPHYEQGEAKTTTKKEPKRKRQRTEVLHAKIGNKKFTLTNQRCLNSFFSTDAAHCKSKDDMVES